MRTLRFWPCFALSIGLLAFAGRLSAQQPARVIITHPETLVSPKMMDRVTWDSNAFYQIYKERSYENLVLLSVVTHAYQSNPSLDPQVAIGMLNKLHDEYKTKYRDAAGEYHLPEGPVEATQSMLNLAGAYGGPEAAAAKPVADEILKWGLKAYQYYERGSRQIEAQKYLSDTASYAELLGRSVDEAFLISQDNENPKTAIINYFSHIFNANPGDSAAAIKQKNPDFKLSSDVNDLLISSENNKLSTDKLRAAVAKYNQQLMEELVKVRKGLVDLTAAQTAYIAAQSEERTRIINEADRARYEINIEGARSSVYLLSTLATLLQNPSLAHTISVTGNATIQIIDAVQKYNAAITVGTSSVNKVASSVTLTANWVSAGLALASLMQPGGTSDQIIISQLNAMRQQLAQLRKEMHERFDQIDLKLNQLFEVMGNQFDELVKLLNDQTVRLAEISAAAARLDQGLLELNLGLTAMEARLQDYMRAGFDRDLDRQLKLCFSPAQPMNQAEFNRCLFNLKYQASDVSLDPLRSTLLDDATIFDVSANRPMAASYVYMARVGGERFQNAEMQSLEGQLATPIEWNFAVDAFIELGTEWPQFSKHVSEGDIRDLAVVGETLKRMSKASRQPSLYEALFANYRARVETLRRTIQAAEDDYAHTKVPGGNAFRRGDKAFNYIEPAVVKSGILLPCPFGMDNYLIPTQTLDLPKGIEGLLPEEMRMADTLGIVKVQFCYAVQNYYESRSTKIAETVEKLPIYKFKQAPAIRIIAFCSDPDPAYANILIIGFDRQISSSSLIWWAWKTQDDAAAGHVPVPDKNAVRDALKVWPTELRDKFISESTAQFKDGWEEWSRKNASERINPLLNRRFDQLTHDYYVSLVQRFNGGADAVGVAARGITAGRILILAFLEIGYADALEKDDDFRALLNGMNALPSGQDIAMSFDDVLQAPGRKLRAESLAALKKLNVEPSKDALIQRVRVGDSAAVFWLLGLGYWGELNQEERASLMQDAKKVKDLGVVLDLLEKSNKGTFDPYQGEEVGLSKKPYEYMGRILDDRLKLLSNKITQYEADNAGRQRVAFIDDRLDRLTLFAQFYGPELKKPVGRTPSTQ